MTVSLPKAVDAYFSGTNAHEPEAIAHAFAEGGVVHDEGKVHRGRAEIAEWARHTVNEYRMTVTPVSATQANGSAVVKGRVAGTFPGSPIELTFNFELGDEGITSLKVRA